MTASTPIEIWFQMRPGLASREPTRIIWAPIGARPLMVRDNRHDSAYIFGAICPQRGVGAPMITPAANTEMMNLHLAEISMQVAEGAIAVLICDGAGWHQLGGELVVRKNIVLLHLPPYSPELNPLENVWDYLRQNKLCALVWNSYDDIVEACKTAWNWLIADPARTTSVGTREWACVQPLGGLVLHSRDTNGSVDGTSNPKSWHAISALTQGGARPFYNTRAFHCRALGVPLRGQSNPSPDSRNSGRFMQMAIYLATVVSRSVCSSNSAFISAPISMMIVEIQIHVMKPTAAPSDPYVLL